MKSTGARRTRRCRTEDARSIKWASYTTSSITVQLRILPHDDFFHAQLTGLVSVDAWEQALRELGAALQAAQGERLVVDLTGLVGWLGVPERTAVGALMAAHLGRAARVALFIQPHKIAGVVEAEARRQGLDLRMFPSYDDAVGWVLSPAAPLKTP